jgi:hypothetical protein
MAQALLMFLLGAACRLVEQVLLRLADKVEQLRVQLGSQVDPEGIQLADKVQGRKAEGCLALAQLQRTSQACWPFGRNRQIDRERFRRWLAERLATVAKAFRA